MSAKQKSLREALAQEALYGTGAMKSALDAVAALKVKDENLGDLLQAFHNNGIWVMPEFGKYRGRPCWIEGLSLVAGSGIYAHVRIPSLKGNDDHVDDHYNRTIYLTKCIFVRPLSIEVEGCTIVKLVVHHYKSATAINPTAKTYLNINLKKFLR